MNMSVFPCMPVGFDSSHQSFVEDETNILPSTMSSSILDTSPSIKSSKNNDIKPMTLFNHQQNEEFSHSSQVVMSEVVCVHSPSNRSNDHRSQNLYVFDQQMMTQNNNKHRETIRKSTNLLSNNTNDEEHCQICGDLSSGWHCGAITCEACKKFFLRSMSTGDGKKKYKCQRDLSCSITKRSRTQCQYCRFQKCITVGMKPHESAIGPKTEDLYKKLPCLVCGGSASGIHFGAVTCEACKGFFRRSIKENAPERYHCAENNNCAIISTSKISCRACRFRKCIEAGMSMDASRIGRQSNLFKESIRQLQNGSTSMATMKDSARIASMAKKRKIKAKNGRVFASKNEIEVELSPTIKNFIEKVHNAYIVHLKDLPRCVPRETVWWTMASQMIAYAQAIINFSQNIIPGFANMCEKYEVISLCINSLIMTRLLSETTLVKSSFGNCESSLNYWHAETRLAMELNAHVPQLTEVENLYRSFESKLKDFQLDEKELSLLLLMIITRTNLNVINEETKSWTKCQFECVQAFSEYIQARRSNVIGEMPFEFYDIVFLVSQLRTLNIRIRQCLMNLPWPYIGNLPSFFYRIYFPNISNMSSVLNSNPDSSSVSPSKLSFNSIHRYDNELFSDSQNSNSIDVRMLTNNYGAAATATTDISSNNESTFWTTPLPGSSAQSSWCMTDTMTTRHSCSSSSSTASSSSTVGKFDSRPVVNTSDDISVSIHW